MAKITIVIEAEGCKILHHIDAERIVNVAPRNPRYGIWRRNGQGVALHNPEGRDDRIIARLDREISAFGRLQRPGRTFRGYTVPKGPTVLLGR